MAEELEIVSKLRNLLLRHFRVEVSDGRTITGIFVCIDSDRNLVLRDCMETRTFPLPLKGKR